MISQIAYLPVNIVMANTRGCDKFSIIEKFSRFSVDVLFPEKQHKSASYIKRVCGEPF